MSAPSSPLAPWPYPRWIAHRGAGKLAPENTLAAFRMGAQYGYRMFECDAKLSSDGVPFLMHDAWASSSLKDWPNVELSGWLKRQQESPPRFRALRSGHVCTITPSAASPCNRFSTRN